MSEEPNSPQPDEPLKTEDAGSQADAKPAAGSALSPAAGESAASAGGESKAAAGGESKTAAGGKSAEARSEAAPEASKSAEATAEAAPEGSKSAAGALTEGTPGAEDAGAIPPMTKFEGDISMRRSPWKSSWAAIKYVQGAAKTDHVQIRTSDRVTIIALLFFCIAEVLSLVYSPLSGFRYAFMCCCDIILGTCIVLFLVYRIGILSALNTRQALICWQMMMGCVFLGIFLCLNTIFAIAYLVETFFPHPLL